MHLETVNVATLLRAHKVCVFTVRRAHVDTMRVAHQAQHEERFQRGIGENLQRLIHPWS